MHIDDPGVSFWHSAEVTWDGQYVVFDDESLGNDTCQQANQGRIRIYRVSDARLMASYMVPRPQGNYCSVHNGNLIPVARRYLMVAAWYYGDTSVIDFTNPSSPQEIGYYDPEGSPTAGEAWSSYWYNGKDLHELLPWLATTPVLSRLLGPRRRGALTGRWARQERHRRATARVRASLSRARG